MSRRAKGRISPQEAAFDRMYNSGEYRHLTLRVECMYCLHGLLNNDEERLLNLVFEGLSWPQIAAVMNISAETCRQRKWPKIVVKAAWLYFGELIWDRTEKRV
jgi:DNA-directed RNA polymerase specialized sigma24 family protein